MEKRRDNNYASFSSTLLDAIYRSIDDTANIETPNPRKTPIDAGISRRLPPPPEITRSTVEHWSRRNSSGRDHHRRSKTPTSSSSDTSSYGGFSSSEAESITASQPSRNRPIGTSAAGSSSFPSRSGRNRPSTVPPPVVAGGDEKTGKKDRHGSIGNRLMRDLWRGGIRSPASPGFRFANFFNSLFASKSKGAGNGEESACSTASAFSRSCLSKTKGKTGPGKRTVKLCPAGAVDGDGGKLDEKIVGGMNRAPLPEGMKRRMEEKEEGGESDSSSDLFELENMAVMGRFQDELPVYQTTNPASYSVSAAEKPPTSLFAANRGGAGKRC